ncbi:MAG: LytTR family transcriptional regulator DNA-binding domain-containing protein [Bacteroidales bacterium]|nr:LytTR family transcriptional regulator DNA-binding domain-containing protein [Bacteroidales bacterium]MBN2756334.1 LytTR family transcriptional regulator DNA-binding domain-containing protein [Bacteroidales bacterium]
MISKLKAIIIEDEQPAIDLLIHYLKEIDKIEIIGSYKDGFSGLKAINELEPELVFLDIQMPKLTGLELIELIDKMPLIIFTTAYDEFAIKAFEINAVDYLLKPYSKERLQNAIDKAFDKIKDKNTELIDYQKIKEYELSLKHEKIDRIVVKTGNKIKIIPADEIIYLDAEDDYVMIYTNEGRYLKQATMKFFENSLNQDKFFRIHRSYIVNIEQIKQIEPYEKDSHIAILKNNVKLKISKSGYKNIKEKLRF